MKLEQLQHLVAIVRHGSLRSASRHLAVPQPALTRSVRALEKELGAALFIRDPKGMVLTAVGRRFHGRAESIVHEARRARDEVSQDGADATGEIVVAMSIMPHVGMLPYALPIFRQRFPDVHLNIIESLYPNVERELRQGSIDFYLGAVPQASKITGLTVNHLFRNPRAVVCRVGHPLSRARSLKELAGADWATTAIDDQPDSGIGAVFRQYGLPAPRVLIHAQSSMSILMSLLHTDIIAMLPAQWTQLPITKSTLTAIAIREALPAPGVALVRRPDLPLTPAAEHFCDILLRYCR
jgi:DNA-binding transcriptional LysR family regulator